MHIVTVPADFEFRTVVTAFAIPSYDSLDDLSSLPAGFTQFGTVTFQPTGMLCSSSPSGINSTSSPVLSDGLLIDLKVMGDISVGEAKIIEIYDSVNNRKISVHVNFITKEVWLGDGTYESKPGFRPLTKETSFLLRITTSIVDGKLIARLYTNKLDAFEGPTLQQTIELTDNPDPPTVGSGIVIGRITGNNDIEFSDLGILYTSNPDEYYPFPLISEIFPIISKLDGGDNISVILDEIIDIELGSENFRTNDNIDDVSVGGGGITISDGKLILEVNGAGTATAQFLKSFSGDLPSGADISISLETDQSIINSPPQLETILAAVELRAGGATVAIELVADSINDAFFRIISKTETVTLLKSTLIDVTNNSHTIRLLRADSKLIILINGSDVIDLTFRSGIALLKTYCSSPSAATSFVTEFSNFVVRPILVIGDQIANV